MDVLNALNEPLQYHWIFLAIPASLSIYGQLFPFTCLDLSLSLGPKRFGRSGSLQTTDSLETPLPS